MPECLFKKETLVQMISCKFCEISKNSFIYKTPPVVAFERRRKYPDFKIFTWKEEVKSMTFMAVLIFWRETTE